MPRCTFLLLHISPSDAVDGALTRHRKCHKVIVIRITGVCSGGSAERDCRWENEVASVRPRTARVMTTLMRNGRDRRSENPLLGHARKERVLLPGTDQRITSWPAATAAASQPRETSERQQAEYMAAPEPSQKSQIFPLHRGRRPYMALFAGLASGGNGRNQGSSGLWWASAR